MEPYRSIEIVQALANGVDPFTGQQSPPSASPHQQAGTVRALHLALEGLTKLRRSTVRKTGPTRGWPEDEVQEETRFIIVPLNTNRVDDIRWLHLADPYDDDQRNGRPKFPYGKPVNPDITLHWEAGNSLALLGGGNVFTGEIKINAKTTAWPLDYAVRVLDSEFSFRIFARGQATGSGKALDTIHGRIVNVDLDVDANHDGKINETDERPEENPGGLACVCTNNLTPIELKLQPAGLPGKVTLYSNASTNKIRLWHNANRSGELAMGKVTGSQWKHEWAKPAGMPATLYVEGVTNSTAARDVELRLEYDENQEGQSNPLFKCEDRVRLTVIRVDLDIWNGGSDLDNGQSAGSQGAQVPEGSEVLIGAYVLVNWDDDDADRTMNADGTWSALPVPDLTDNSVANEDNLAKLKPTVEPLLDTGSIELEVSGADADKVKLWTQRTKGTELR